MDPPRRDTGSGASRAGVARRLEIANESSMRVFCLTEHWCSQANEGMWGMPGHTEATKAAVSCDKPGGGAHTL